MIEQTTGVKEGGRIYSLRTTLPPPFYTPCCTITFVTFVVIIQQAKSLPEIGPALVRLVRLTADLAENWPNLSKITTTAE